MKNSLEYYRRAAADSDDSDCDLLVQKPIFASRKKQKQTENDSGSSIVSLSQNSLESNVSTILTKEQVENKGRCMSVQNQNRLLGLEELNVISCPILQRGK